MYLNIYATVFYDNNVILYIYIYDDRTLHTLKSHEKKEKQSTRLSLEEKRRIIRR